MFGNHVFAIALCFVTLLTACDHATDAAPTRMDEAAGMDDIQSAAAETDIMVGAKEPADSAKKAVETFRFSTDDVVAVGIAQGSLFAPFPLNIPTFDEEEINNGFLLAIKLYDQNRNLVGFGTEQEVLDLANERSSTTYTLTLPARGTLMFAQEENLNPLLTEVADMIATNELVRTFDPPWVVVSTIPGTDRVIGGTGEFEKAKSKSLREIDIVHKIDLVDRAHELEIVLEIELQ